MSVFNMREPGEARAEDHCFMQCESKLSLN